MMRKYLTIIALAVSFAQCRDKDPSDLTGTWRIDSAYAYYNGFGHAYYDMTVKPSYEFQEDGKLKMTINDESRYQHFNFIPPDTLILASDNGNARVRYQIIVLTANNLVLKEEKKPLFKEGGSQERYELRYFSRIKN